MTDLHPKGLEAVTRMLALFITGKHVSELPFDRSELKEWHREGRTNDINTETKESIAEAAAGILTAYLSAAEPWLPIESAPKDGTPVLVWRPDEGDRKHRAHADVDVFREGSWYHSRKPQQPTHWMPLPEAPRQGE